MWSGSICRYAKCLGTPCRWCLLDSTQSQRRGKQLQSTAGEEKTAEHCKRYNPDFEKNRKTRTIKEATYSKENGHDISGISFKLPNVWKPKPRESKAKKTNSKIQPLKLQHHQTESKRSTNKYGSTQARSRNQPIKNDLEIFQSSAKT